MLWTLFTARWTKTPTRTRKPQIESLEDRTTPSTLVALTTNDVLLTFDSANPSQIQRSVRVRGLAAGEDIRGIDTRPANGLIYGVTNLRRLYSINPFTGVATRIGQQMPFGLTGISPGIDFNPTVDRIRAVSPGDQNFRINPNDGNIVDGNPNLDGIQGDTPLAYAAGDRFEGRNPNIVGSAYTNNFLGATTTTLYGIDSVTDTLVRQGGLNGAPPSPNGGQLFTVGDLGVRTTGDVAFEITSAGVAFAALRTNLGPFGSRLAVIDLTTGRATLLGRIGNGQTIDGLAELSREEIVFGVTASNKLVRFRASDPGTLLSSQPINGLQAGENVSGIDFRPATGELFALTSTNRVLRIDTTTAQGIQVGNPLDAALFAANQKVGVDFNPTVDRLRLANDANDNLRYNPVTFAPVDGNATTDGVQGDTDLAFVAMGDPASGQDPNVVAVAYDRNDNDPTTPTTLFGIDSTTNTLVRQGGVDGVGVSPNGGQLFTIGALGVNPTDVASFDIIGNGSGGNGIAMAVLQLQGETVSRLYTINLATGAATAVGVVGGGEVITAMSIAPSRITFGAPVFVAGEGSGSAVIVVRRVGGSSGTATVQFSTSDDSAIAGTDYTTGSMMLTFAPGETSKFVRIPILNDRMNEPVETVNLTLSAASGNGTLLGSQATAVLAILDNDGGFGSLLAKKRG